jgi:hypothetical protein
LAQQLNFGVQTKFRLIHGLEVWMFEGDLLYIQVPARSIFDILTYLVLNHAHFRPKNEILLIMGDLHLKIARV